MNTKEFFSIELTSLILDKHEGDDFEYFNASMLAYDIQARCPQLKENLESWWKNYPISIDPDLIKAEVSRLIKWVKKFPVSNRKYINSKKRYPSYGKHVHVEDVEATERALETNLELFNRPFNPSGTFIIDDYYWLRDFVEPMGDHFYKEKILRMRKPKLEDWMHVEEVFRFFGSRVKQVADEKQYHLNKREFKKAKKNIYVFQVDTIGTRMSLDWFEKGENHFKVVVSHLSKELAKNSLFTTYNDGNLIDGLVKDLSHNKIDQLTPDFMKITLLESTKENIEEAVKHRKNMWSPKYDQYGRFFLKNYDMEESDV
jgi:hypothetical protein